MANNVLSDARKKVKIPGLRVPVFFDRMVGKSQAKKGMILEDKGSWKTPWLERKNKCRTLYIEKQYEMAARQVEPWQVEAEAALRELAFLNRTSVNADNQESRQRETAGREAKKQSLINSLANIDAKLESLDALLLHRTERANSTLMTHVYGYWEGALKKSGEKAIPPVPDFQPEESPAKTLYTQRKTALQQKIQDALTREEA